MLFSVQVSPRKRVWVEIIQDDGINAGGFYCKVFGDETKEFELNDFALSWRYFRAVSDPSRKMALSQSLAIERVKAMFRR